MTAPDRTGGKDRTAGGAARASGTTRYVYGIVPEDVELDPDARGVGDPPRRIDIVRHGEIAALVSEVDAEEPPGEARDLEAHRDLLDATAAEVPVLPVQFGMVVADREELVGQLLSPHHDEFAAALRELDGKAEYVVEGRYGEQPPAESGGTVADTITRAIGRYCSATHVRDDPGAGDAVEVAVLMETARQDDLERDVGELAGRWDDRVDLRVLGPLAAYDFVTALTPAD